MSQIMIAGKLTKSELDSMKETLMEIISDRTSFLDSKEDRSVDNDDYNYVESIQVGDKDPYTDCVDTLFNIGCRFSGEDIQGYSWFFDPRRKFSFDTYDEKECDAFREYLVNEYGVDKELLV
jgi:hypothetical protein